MTPTPKARTAEQVADAIIGHCELGKGHKHCSRAQAIADITAYAESQRVNRWADRERIVDWIEDPKRKPANLAFTEGPDRQVAYAVEWYAEERVKEALRQPRYCHTKEHIDKARAEALEEAAKIADHHPRCSKHCILPEAIRALKEKS